MAPTATTIAVVPSHEAVRKAKDEVTKLKVDGPSKDELVARREVVRLFWELGNSSAAVGEAQHLIGRARALNDKDEVVGANFLLALLHAALGHEALAKEVARAGLTSSGQAATAEESMADVLVRLSSSVSGKFGKLEQKLLDELDPKLAEEIRLPSLRLHTAQLAESDALGLSTQYAVTKLRGFAASPSSGTSESLTWAQTMGRMTLEYELDGTGWQPEDLEVMVSSWQLQVKARGALLEYLSGEFAGDAIREGCWWKIWRKQSKEYLIISIAKKKARVWSAGPWNKAALNPRRFKDVAWTKVQKNELSLKEVGKDLIAAPQGPPEIEEQPPGYLYPSSEARMFAMKSKYLKFTPDDLCVGIEVKQDKASVTAEVHFDGFALDWVEKQFSYEDIFACDVWETGLYIFLIGDELNPFLWLEFDGQVLPEKTSWAMSTTDTFRNRQRKPGDASPTLKVKCMKSPRSPGIWPKPFTWCAQTRLAFSDGEQMARFQPMPGATVLRRAGYDPEEPDFVDFVEEVLADVAERSGHMSATKQADLLREVMRRVEAEVESVMPSTQAAADSAAAAA